MMLIFKIFQSEACRHDIERDNIDENQMYAIFYLVSGSEFHLQQARSLARAPAAQKQIGILLYAGALQPESGQNSRP